MTLAIVRHRNTLTYLLTYSLAFAVKISELSVETDRVHEQALSRQHEIKAVIASLGSFKSKAESLSARLTQFKEDIHQRTTKPVSADVEAIKAELHLTKVSLCFCFLTVFCVFVILFFCTTF